MLRVFGDFETFYDWNYTLNKVSPVEYILDPRWETLGCAIAIEHEDAQFWPQDEVADVLRAIKEPYCFISHNALFDACILAYRYDIHPPAMLCTLSMSRALLLHKIPTGRISLATVLKFLGLPAKGEFIKELRGKRYRDIVANPALVMGMVSYAINDVNGCRDIFFTLREQFPAREALVMDRVIRMATQPVLELDTDALENYYGKVKAQRMNLLAQVNVSKPELMSNIQFASVLETYGVDPPMKISPTTGKETYAFARTDAEFMALLEHDDPNVQALMAARLGLKSTIEETRAIRFIAIGGAMRNNRLMFRSEAWKMAKAPAYLPVPLKYGGAHTHRFSGDWKLNMQNLSARKSKELRKAIIAPEGHTIVAVDASQIEARLTAWLADQTDLLQMFADGEDTYRWFASSIFGCLLSEVIKPQRFVGKTCILGLGFGMSAKKLYHTITTLAREQEIDISITFNECSTWNTFYRQRFLKINQIWETLGNVIRDMANGDTKDLWIGPCKVDGTTVMLPSGLKLNYHELKEIKGEYFYRYGQFTKKIYGGKLLENVVQALDRQHVVEANARTEARAIAAGIDPYYARILLNIHDENVYCVPDEQAFTLMSIALEEMRTNSAWSEGLPLAAEVKYGKNLGELEEWR